MDTILLSRPPEQCKKIFNGEQTIIALKTAPKPPFKAVVCCADDRHLVLIQSSFLNVAFAMNPKSAIIVGGEMSNGKVVGEFICDYVIGKSEEYLEWEECDVTESGLSIEDFLAYAGNKIVYGVHVSASKLYDNPKEVTKYKKPFHCAYDRGTSYKDCADCIGSIRTACSFNSYIKGQPHPWQRIQDIEEKTL